MAVFITSDNQVAGYCNTMMRARSIDREGERERESELDELIKTGDELSSCTQCRYKV